MRQGKIDGAGRNNGARRRDPYNRHSKWGVRARRVS
jgi:hypothetical protein